MPPGRMHRRAPTRAWPISPRRRQGPRSRPPCRRKGRRRPCILLLIPAPRRTGPTARACILLLIPLRARAWKRPPPRLPKNPNPALRRTARACIFLLIPSRAGSNWAVHHTRGTAAAPHKSLVSINENTSAHRRAGNRREAGTDWNCYRNRRTAAACGAAGGQNIKPEQPRRRPGAASGMRSNSLPAERLKPRRAPVNPCRSLLHPCGPAGNGCRIVKACRSLLIHRPRPEPVRSGGDRARPDGHRLPRRPPSPLTESGGRP